MKGIKRVVFDNGLVLLMEKKTRAKEAVILIGTSRGSMYEPPELSGVTHFIEHMLFRTNRWKTTQEIIEELESAGGDINAFTDQSMMYFYAEVIPSEKEISKTINIVFEAVTNDKYQRDEFLLEKDNILSELKICIEHPTEYLYYNLSTNSFPRHTTSTNHRGQYWHG